MAKPPPKVPEKADDKEQSERFIETARDHETDESGRALEEAFKRVSSRQHLPETKAHPTHGKRRG